MEERMKNIPMAEVLRLKELVAYQPGQVVSRTLAQNKAVSVTLFSFDKGEEISTHASGGDAFVSCLDGEGKITIDDKPYVLREGDAIVMPPDIPTPSMPMSSLKCCWWWYFSNPYRRNL